MTRGAGRDVRRPHELRLGADKTVASPRTRAAWMDGQSHCRRCARGTAPRSRGICGRPACRSVAADVRAKGRQTRQFHRSCPPTQIPQFLDRRCPPDSQAGRAPSASACEPYRADRGGRGARSQCCRDLSRPRRRSRLHGEVRERPPLRPEAPRNVTRQARVVITTAPREEGQAIATATGRWCAIRAPANTNGCASSC